MLLGQWLDWKTPGIPRTADGKPDLTAPAPMAADGKPDLTGLSQAEGGKFAANIVADLKADEIAPWAAALHAGRKESLGKGFMSVACLPFGPMATVQTEGGPARIIQTPTLIAILFADMSHRRIFLDGRALPKNPNPAFMGYSVGRWDGDTLVVESTGFNDRTWLDAEGHPHTEELRTTERIHRHDFGHIDLDVTFSDPKAYQKPFSVKTALVYWPDTEMLEYVCNENEKDRDHLVGKLSDIPVVELPAEVLARYAGTYEVRPPDKPSLVRQAVVTVQGKGLLLDYNGSKQELIPQDETTFSTPGPPVVLKLDALGRMTFTIAGFNSADTVGVRGRMSRASCPAIRKNPAEKSGHRGKICISWLANSLPCRELPGISGTAPLFQHLDFLLGRGTS